MTETYDVAVIGAGPAGGNAALFAAKNGLNTVLLEEHESIGEPVHCGECLSDLCVQKFGLMLPREAVALEVKGVRVIFPDKTSRVVNEKGYVLEKARFEQFLAGEAEKAGAAVKLGHRVNDLKRENGVWTLATTKGEVRAKIVIDASGVQAVTSNKLGLNPRFKAVIGMQYEMAPVENDGYMDFYLWPKLAPEGYLWMIPKCRGRANVGLVTTERNKAKTFLDEFCEVEGFKDKQTNKTFGGLIPASGPLEKTVADGLMLVGDAAGFTSPLFEGGTHLGMMSGKFAADVAAEAIKAGDLSAAFLSRYERLWKAEFPPYAKIVEGRDALYGFSDEELNDIAHLMPRKPMNHLTFLDKASVGLRVLLTRPHYLGKGFVKAMNAFGYSLAKYYGW